MGISGMWECSTSATCVNGAVQLHGHVDARCSIGGDIHGQILFALCWREEKLRNQAASGKWQEVTRAWNLHTDWPCPLLSLRLMGLKWEARASRFCCRACCMRRCCSSASCNIFFSGQSAAAPRSSLSFRCSRVAAWTSCCCCPRARAMGTRPAMIGVDISSNARGEKEGAGLAPWGTSLLAWSGETKQTWLLLQFGAGGCAQAVVSSWGGLHRGWGEEGVWGGARGGAVSVQAVGVAGAPAFSAIAVDGSLQLPRRAEALLLTLKRVQILHIPARQDQPHPFCKPNLCHL